MYAQIGTKIFAAKLFPWLIAIFGVVLVAVILEGLVLTFVGRRRYDWRAFAATSGDVIGRRVFDSLGISIAAPVLAWAYTHRITTITLHAPWAFALLFFGQEFFYYWYHRTAHTVRWFWATHAVHHSPNELTLAAALRLGWTGKITGVGIFFVPLIWLGFAPEIVLGLVGLNLLYQFWLHAPWLPKLGPLEWVFNTPTHHSIHHASNPEYLDCNYGGVLIIFDRLFGTFRQTQPEIVIRYGLSEPIVTYNPVKIELNEWIKIKRDLFAARDWHSRIAVLIGPVRPCLSTEILDEADATLST